MAILWHTWTIAEIKTHNKLIKSAKEGRRILVLSIMETYGGVEQLFCDSAPFFLLPKNNFRRKLCFCFFHFWKKRHFFDEVKKWLKSTLLEKVAQSRNFWKKLHRATFLKNFNFFKDFAEIQRIQAQLGVNSLFKKWILATFCQKMAL